MEPLQFYVRHEINDPHFHSLFAEPFGSTNAAISSNPNELLSIQSIGNGNEQAK